MSLLPKATFQKMVPHDQVLTADAIDILNMCGAKFVAMITGEANEIAEHEGKTIVAAEHFLKALKDLGLEEYHDEVEEVAKEAAKQQTNKNNKKRKTMDEELLKEQEELFEEARAKFEQRGPPEA